MVVNLNIFEHMLYDASLDLHVRGVYMMRAECYYQTTIEKALPFIFLTKAQCVEGLHILSEFERNCLAAQQFKGYLGSIAIIPDKDGKACKIYVGAADGNTESLALASVAKLLPEGSYVAEQQLSKETLVAWSLAQYQFDKYKINESRPRILVVRAEECKAIVAESAAVFLVRDLINTPTNDLGPEQLADVVAKLAEDHGGLFKQWVGNELIQANFPAIHAVGRAAAAKPRLLSLVWGQENHPRVTLVGKGVCFDSGGLDIKPSSGMRLMKKDMGGAAHVIGLAQWLMANRVPIRLQVLIPAVENAVSAESYRPGDVLTMRNGLKVEIHDTDAEGRLVLADALVKACEEQPELIIDFATLTGAARVAVGADIAAMFVNDEPLAHDLAQSANQVNDPVWRLPLHEGYADLFASSIADFSNASTSSYGGAITAALFLKRFIAANIPWVHFDVMAWNLGNRPGKPEGGEAMGLRAVGHYLMARYR